MKRLTLIHNLDGEQQFTVGANCDELVALDNGGYTIIRGEKQITVPPSRVDHFTHEPRPGLTDANPEQPPPGMKLWTDGFWHCNDCKFKAKSAHGVKTHRGMAHDGA